MRSRRALDPEAARSMVAIREARRAARRAVAGSAPLGTPADTTAAAQAVQDTLWRRIPVSEKLMQVARLSRAVDDLFIAGLRQRHPTDSQGDLFYRRAESRLGPQLASRVYGAARGVS